MSKPLFAIQMQNDVYDNRFIGVVFDLKFRLVKFENAILFQDRDLAEQFAINLMKNPLQTEALEVVEVPLSADKVGQS